MSQALFLFVRWRQSARRSKARGILADCHFADGTAAPAAVGTGCVAAHGDLALFPADGQLRADGGAVRQFGRHHQEALPGARHERRD